MKKIAIRFGFTHFGDVGLLGKTREILGKMKGNKNFPDPSPKLEDIEKQADAYETSLAALDGSLVKTKIKDKERKALESMLRLLGLYVMQVADDDEIMLATSGYDLVKDPEHTEFDGQISNFGVVVGAVSGSMELSSGRVKDARGYVFEYTLAPALPDSQWTMVTDSKSVHIFENLEPGKQYCFRMAAIGKGSKLVFTDVISRFVS